MYILKCLLLVGAAVFAGAVPSFGTSSLDLTPVSRKVQVDGATRNLVFFRSGQIGLGRISLVEYSPPWPITGAPDAATMSVPGKEATASIHSVEMTEPLEFDDEAAVVEWVKGYIPPESSRLEVEGILHDPVKLNGSPTVEVSVSFALYGRAIRMSVFLCHRRGGRPEELFVFKLEAKPDQFKETHAAFQASLYTIVGF